MAMKARKVPMRLCLGCQEMKPKRELFRIVRTPEGEIDFDPTGKRNGRGAYICPQKECLRAAIKARRFDKAFGQPLTAEVVELLERKLES